MQIQRVALTAIQTHLFFSFTPKTEVKADTQCLSKGAFSIIETRVTKIDIDELCLEPKNSITH